MKVNWSGPASSKTISPASTTPLTAAPRGTWPASPMAPALSYKALRICHRPEAMPPPPWCGTRHESSSSLRFAITAITNLLTASTGLAWQRSPAARRPRSLQRRAPPILRRIGSIACPIFRGALAVNPQSGDTFAWTVDQNNQDQGLWQDQCAISSRSCTNASITFAQQWSTAALEASTLEGAATIADGDYNLALAAVPSQQDTLVLAGANDLWKCSLAMGCVWRNTTNSTTCMSAQVGGYQHALGWNAANPLEDFRRQRQRPLALDRCHRRNRLGMLGHGLHALPESEWQPGLAGRGSESPLCDSLALHADGRPGRQRHRGREELALQPRIGRRFSPATAVQSPSIPGSTTTGTSTIRQAWPSIFARWLPRALPPISAQLRW